MATRIAQLDLLDELRPIGGLDGYADIWLLVKHGRRPLGWVKFPRSVCGDMLLPEVARTLIAAQLGVQIWDSILRGPPPEPTHQPPVSVIVCTREHPDVLERQLRSLGELRYPEYEVIVVDNAPTTDQTRQVCARFAFARHIVEPQPGLDFARNTGWRSARHDIVAYTDDDAVADPHWLSAIGAAFEDADVVCVTGLTLPLELETAAQEHFEDYGGFGRGFMPRVHRPRPWETFYPLGAGQFGSGVNMALRKSFLNRIGGFDNALDTGSPGRAGGDLDIYARTIRHGGTLVYEPLAIVHHQHRRLIPQLRRQMYDYGFGYAAFLSKYHTDPELAHHAADAWRQWFRRTGWNRLRRSFKLMLQRRPRFPMNLILREMVGLVAGRRAYPRIARQVSDSQPRHAAPEAG